MADFKTNHVWIKHHFIIEKPLWQITWSGKIVKDQKIEDEKHNNQNIYTTCPHFYDGVLYRRFPG